MKWFLSIFIAGSFVFLLCFGVNCCYGYVFPLKYSREIESACENFGVKEEIVYSVINIESHFNKNALSNKGAVGLMQIMPSTAEELAKNLSVEDFDLTNPKDNIMLGTFYISQLLKKFENEETALCAYNAGPSNVQSWLSDSEKSSDGEALDYIPFKETRDYIEKYRKNIKYYTHKVG